MLTKTVKLGRATVEVINENLTDAQARRILNQRGYKPPRNVHVQLLIDPPGKGKQ